MARRAYHDSRTGANLTPRMREAAARAAEIPTVPWETFVEALRNEWEQGEPMTLLGRTNSGKTTAAIQILDVRRYVVAILTKRKDDLFPRFRKHGYKMLKPGDDWPEHAVAPRVAMHISPSGLSRADSRYQAALIRETLSEVWEQGNWTLYLDEIAQLSDLLRLDTELRSLWKEARSSGVTIVAGTQRPSRVPIEAYSQPRFLLLWRTNDRDQLKRLGDMNAVDPDPVRVAVAGLNEHEILVVDTYTDDLVRTTARKLR